MKKKKTENWNMQLFDSKGQKIRKRFWLLNKYHLLLTALFIVATLLQSFAVNAQEKNASFLDIKGSEWYAKDVLELANNPSEIIKGFPDGTFGADKKLGVDQFITMLVRAGGESAENHSEYWAINYLHKAKEMGFLKEGDFTDFKAQIKREEMAVLIIRFLEQRENISEVNTEEVETLIMDYEMIGQRPKRRNYEQREAVKKNYVLGVLTGYEDASFQPTRILTRAEAATVVVRVLNPARRIKYQPEILRQNREKEMEKRYYGGSKWINPADAKIDKLTRVKEDWKVTTGQLRFSPTIHNLVQGTGNYPKLSIDELRGTLHYDEKGPKAGQLEDFEQLLKRRMSKTDVEKIMDYLRKKKNIYTHLKFEGVDIFTSDGKYLVRLGETVLTEEFGGLGYKVGFNIWYMQDPEWIKLYNEIYDYQYPKIKLKGE